jgi:hypothetical protein
MGSSHDCNDTTVRANLQSRKRHPQSGLLLYLTVAVNSEILLVQSNLVLGQDKVKMVLVKRVVFSALVPLSERNAIGFVFAQGLPRNHLYPVDHLPWLSAHPRIKGYPPVSSMGYLLSREPPL